MVLHSFDNAIDISLKNKENAIIAVGDINITEEIRALQLNEIFKDPFNPSLDSEQCTCLTDTFCSFAEGKSFCVIDNNKCKVYKGCGTWGQENCEGTCKDIKN